MSRFLQLLLGIVALAAGITLCVVIAAAWSACGLDQMPFDESVSPECVATVDASPTAWALEFWFIALPVSAMACVWSLARDRRVAAKALVALLAVVVLLAFPIMEYVLLANITGAWDEAPFTGVLTALSFVLAGIILLALPQRRVRTAAG